METDLVIKLAHTRRAVEATDVNMSGSTFYDVNLSNATFNDVNLSGAQVQNVCLSGLRITDANLSVQPSPTAGRME